MQSVRGNLYWQARLILLAWFWRHGQDSVSWKDHPRLEVYIMNDSVPFELKVRPAFSMTTNSISCDLMESHAESKRILNSTNHRTGLV